MNDLPAEGKVMDPRQPLPLFSCAHGTRADEWPSYLQPSLSRNAEFATTCQRVLSTCARIEPLSNL